MRVVRVGISNNPHGKVSGLWDRLREIRGPIRGKHAGGGNHRVADFRYLVGLALLEQNGLQCPSWTLMEGNAAVRVAEYPLESRVSDYINEMPLLWLSTDVSKNPVLTKKYIRNNTIALLSNCGKAAIDPPSPGWLGNYCPEKVVRLSGVWHEDYIDSRYDPGFLQVVEKMVARM